MYCEVLRRRSHYGRNDGDGSGDGDGRKPNGSHLSVVNEGKMATVDIVLMWINLFSLAQPSSAYRARRIRLRRLSYNVLDQRRPPSSRGSLSRLLSWSSLLVLPPFQDMVRSLRAPRRFWAAPREQGFWEKDVCLLWRNMGKIYPDWEENCYLQHFRMSKDTFWYLCQRRVVAIASFFFLLIVLPPNSSRMSAQMSISFLSTSESHCTLGFLPLAAIARFFAE